MKKFKSTHTAAHRPTGTWVVPGLFLVMLAFLCVTPVHAYLDPGTGTFILQLILGGVAGVALLLRSYFRRAFAYVSGLLSGRKESADGGEDAEHPQS